MAREQRREDAKRRTEERVARLKKEEDERRARQKKLNHALDLVEG